MPLYIRVIAGKMVGSPGRAKLVRLGIAMALPLPINEPGRLLDAASVGIAPLWPPEVVIWRVSHPVGWREEGTPPSIRLWASKWLRLDTVNPVA